MHQDQPRAQEASSLDPPRERASGGIAQSLAAIIESQAQLNTQTVQVLQTLIGSDEASPAAPRDQQATSPRSRAEAEGLESPSPDDVHERQSMLSEGADDASERVADAQARLERERQQLELDRLDLSVELAAHMDRLEQLEREFGKRLDAALKQSVEELRAEFRVPFDQMQLLLHLIHEAERSLSRLASQSAIRHRGERVERPLAPSQRDDAGSKQPLVESPMPDDDRKQPHSSNCADGTSREVHSPTPNVAATSDEQTDANGNIDRTLSGQTDQDNNEHAGGTHRRQSNRLKVESLECNLGRIMDLSRGGVRLLCPHPPEGDDLRLEIYHDGVTFEAPVEVVWANRLGWRTYQVGLRFKELSEQDIAALTRIGMDSRIRRTIDTDNFAA